MHWALMSSSGVSPSHVCLVLPDWSGSALTALIGKHPDLAHTVLSIPASHTCLLAHGSKDGAGRHKAPARPFGGLWVVVVADAAGKALHVDDPLSDFARLVTDALKGRFPLSDADQ